MNEILEMHGKMVSKYHDKLKKFCVPLVDSFGVNQFYHFKLSNSGKFVSIGLHADWDAIAYSNPILLGNWPTYRRLKSIKTGVVFLLEPKNKPIQLVTELAKSQFNVHHCLEFVIKTNEGIEGYGFGLATSDPYRQMAFIKELPLLKLFLKRYKEEFKKDILFYDNYKANFGKYIGSSLCENEEKQRHQFLKKMGIDISCSLSPREIDIASLLIEGYTASKIGDKLFIAKRTVEHHVERIKDKLGSLSKSDLIQKLSEMENIGYI